MVNTNPNNLTDVQVKAGYSTIPGPYDPVTGAPKSTGMTDAEINAKNALADTHNAGGSNPNPAYVVGANLPSNPVISSSGTRADVNALGNDLKNINDASASSTKLLTERMDALEKRKDAEIAAIKSEYESASKTQNERQNKDYQGQATSLVTAGGGFLGTTGSQTGVLNNLRATHEAEKTALMAKRDAAVQQAQNAFEDKDFELAKSLIKEAKDTEQEIYNRQKDNAEQILAASREKRAQDEYDRGVTTDKLSKYESLVANGENVTLNPNDIKNIDAVYGQGFTQKYIDAAKKTAEAKTKKDKVTLDGDILDMRLKIPLGKKFTLGGIEYTGLKQPDKVAGEKMTVDEKKQALSQKINTLFSPGYVVPGTDHVPILDNNGYATPEGWKAVIKVSGLDRKSFIQDYGYLIPSDLVDKFGLTKPEQELILGKL